MAERQREIDTTKGETGTCPYCGDNNYSRTNIDWDNDTVFADCECQCGNEFKEVFYLISQEWEVKDDEPQEIIVFEPPEDDRISEEQCDHVIDDEVGYGKHCVKCPYVPKGE